MTITIKINTGNAAFEEPNRDAEIARILARCAKDFEAISAGVSHALFDINGNRVGSIVYRGK